MFTGIITDVGRVISCDGKHINIHSHFDSKTINIGSSISCDGVCLTVIHVDGEQHSSVLSFEVSPETKRCTTLGGWQTGRLINLERSLKVGEELAGHMVSGHVDGTARVLTREEEGNSVRFWFEARPEHARFIAPKCSIALDGTSLTVNEVEGCRFTVNLIPHTLTVTTWEGKKKGDYVNLEVDMFARYVERILAARSYNS
ncbi:MAG: riboflavin synthase [Hyphomicrobium sp.]